MTSVKVRNGFLSAKLEKLEIGQLTTSYNLCIRNRKITSSDLLLSFFMMALHKGQSLLRWSVQLGFLIGTQISKQAIWKRFNQQHLDFLRELLQRAISVDMDDFVTKLSVSRGHLFQHFAHVYLQDSTCIQLPDHLAEHFPGSVSKGKRKAVMKVQAIMNIKRNSFDYLEVGSFSKNDQKASADILSLLKPTDLVIRDKGYFVLDVFKKIMAKQAYFISRLRYGINIYDLQGNKLSLKTLTSKGRNVDQKILLSEEKIPVRLILIKVPQQVADRRKRAANNDRDRRLNHGEDYMRSLEYNIFVTNIEDQSLSSSQIAIVYGLRWRIEIVFKCWKSHFNMALPLKQNNWGFYTAAIYIYYTLIFIVIVKTQLYNHFWWMAYQEKGIYLSLLKFSEFMAHNLLLIILSEDLGLITELIFHACAYDKRNDRQNYSQTIFSLNA